MPEGEVQVKEEGKFKAGLKSCGTFLYNSDDGTVMGRGGMSWAKIGTFYIFFYSFLAGFFAINMYVMLSTLDDNVPTVVGRSNKPQVAIKQFKSMKMDLRDEEKFEEYVNAVNETKMEYDNYLAPDAEGAVFRWSHVEAVSSFCGDLTKYSFDNGEGCFFLGLNRIYDFNPAGNSTTARFFFDCEFDIGIAGDGDMDSGATTFDVYPDPASGDLSEFYPWTSVAKNGLQPLVAVKIKFDKDTLNKVTENRPEAAFITCLPYTQTGSEDRVMVENSRFARLTVMYPEQE